ncbi:unnamed protein product [Calypogeia fissa]
MDSRACFGGLLLLLLLFISSVGRASSQTLNGLSIDCGSDFNYTDSDKIEWVTDGGYVRTGKNAQVPGPLNATDLNVNQTKTLRYFDQGRGRDCYVLPVQPQFTYLIRTTFHYGVWNSADNYTDFYVYLNGNPWLEKVFIKGDPLNNVTSWYEVLVYIEGGTTLDLCLLRRTGNPFISAVELRQLAPGMYSTVVGNHKYMVGNGDGYSGRIRMGVDPNGPQFLRYPDDPYDRIWTGVRLDANYRISNPNISTATTLERPPKKVMENAGIYNYDNFDFVAIGNSSSSIGSIAVYSYFQELDGNASATNVRGMEFKVNNYNIDTFNSSDEAYEVRSCILDVYEDFVNISIQKTPWSNLKPMLNAFEIYFVYSWDQSATSSEDVTSIRSLQSLLNLTDWTGDPCLPIPYDWLGCSTNANVSSGNGLMKPSLPIINNLYVTNITLSNVATMRTLPQEIASFANLSYLDLSNTSMESIPYLGLSGLDNLTSLNVSHNRFSGPVVDFVQNVSTNTLKHISAANNSFTGPFPLDLLYSEFPNLEDANFDSNPLIGGTLNVTVWHTILMRSLADPTGVKVAAAATPTPSAAPPILSSFPLVSLKNNNITSIIPSLDSLEADIDTFLRSFNTTPGSTNFGILLGGNPWCEQQPFSAQSLPQQFLCRSYPDEVLPAFRSLYISKKSEPWGIIGGVVGGVVFLASCCCLAAVWRLRKQTSSLKEIQEALARQKVQPPFYSYTDLRAATNDFSMSNKLGQGTFGAVYKGTILDSRDGTLELVAVKTLYPSKQALTEFLNEVVLITGIKHRNLVQLKGCCIHKEDQRMLVYEYAENGNLAEALWDVKPSSHGEYDVMRFTLDWQQRLNICVGIARGLSYLHEELQPRIIHRDIKPYNILIDKNYNAKIADFGLARSMLEGQDQADFTQVAGTRGYFSPEYATQGQLTEKADVFSFGVVLLEIVSGRKVIDPGLPSETQFLQAWARRLKENGKLLDLLDPAVQRTANNEEVMRVINLALLCLDFYPEKRPTMAEAVTMLQGIVDVPLFQPEPASFSPAYRPSNPYDYMELPVFLENLNEDQVSDSFTMSGMSGTPSNNEHTLELSKLSAR